MEFKNQGNIRPQSSPQSSSYGFLVNNGVPFQRGTPSLRISDIESTEEAPVGKKKINLLAKSDANTSGTKRKAEETLSTMETNEPSSDIIFKKKAKEEWKCEVCHISCTSEQALKDHLIGKKHKSKQARDGKNYIIGLLSVNAEQQVQVASEPLKSESGEMNGNTKMYKFWCDVCKMGTNAKKVMKSHERGKKHRNRLSARKNIEAPLNKVDEDGKGISSENVAEPEDDFEAVVKASEDGKHTSIENVTEATDDSNAVVKVDEDGSFEEANDDSNAIVEEEDGEITIS